MSYKSIHKTEFDSAIACELDNTTVAAKFRLLYEFMEKWYPKELTEWLTKRRFQPGIDRIIDTLTDLDLLT